MDECYWDPQAADYRGKVGVSKNGMHCIHWLSGSIDFSRYGVSPSTEAVENFVRANDLDNNFCRVMPKFDEPQCKSTSGVYMPCNIGEVGQNCRKY